MLTGSEIKKRLGKDIIINPFNESQLNPNSYNIRLGNKLLVYTEELDMNRNNKTREIYIPDSGLLLQPNTLYIGSTLEYTETNNLIPCIDGRSSTARLGIIVHHTGGFGDIGFKGTWTLEIACVQPVVIYPYTEIGQIYYFEPTGDIGAVYEGRYQGQIDPISSRFFMK